MSTSHSYPWPPSGEIPFLWVPSLVLRDSPTAQGAASTRMCLPRKRKDLRGQVRVQGDRDVCGTRSSTSTRQAVLVSGCDSRLCHMRCYLLFSVISFYNYNCFLVGIDETQKGQGHQPVTSRSEIKIYSI